MQNGCSWGVGICYWSQQLPTGQIPHGDLQAHCAQYTFTVKGFSPSPRALQYSNKFLYWHYHPGSVGVSYQRRVTWNPFLSCFSKQFTCLLRVDTMCYLNPESCPFGQLSPPAQSPSPHSYLPDNNIKECKVTLLPPNRSNAFLSHRISEQVKNLCSPEQNSSISTATMNLVPPLLLSLLIMTSQAGG